jgi:hypothetical protein
MMNKLLKKTLIAVLLGAALSEVTTLRAATYYVSIAGNNANSGLQASPWRTIQYAANRVTAGDTVRVSAGTYDEAVSISVDGNSNNWVNFIANTNSGPVITRRWEFNSANYVRMIGFEVTHTGTTAYSRTITLVGTCSNIEIIDNYIHHTQWDAIQAPSGTPTRITVRGNRIDYMGTPTGSGMNAISGVPQTPRHWLVEYNHATRFTDFCDMYGMTNIIRNNWACDVHADYWAVIGHPDGFQPGSDGASALSQHHIYERNWTGRSTNEHSHFGIWQDTVNAGDTNHMIRGNVGVFIGGGGVGNIGTDKMSVYDNSFYSMCMLGDGTSLYVAYQAGSANGRVANNIIHTRLIGNAAPITVSAGHQALVTHNWGYAAGTHASFLGTTDPRFMSLNPNSLDTRLQSGSPVRGVGTNLVWATANTTGTTFPINDAQLLSDGWSMVEGDVVVIGNTTTRVTAVDWGANRISVATSVTVTNGQPIWWGRRGDQKDLGAHPFGAEYLTAATMSQNGTTYTVTTTGDARGVWFYVDGIPTHWVYDPIGGPYTATIPSGTVTAKAYAEWAQENPVVTASLGGSRPAAPTNLQVVDGP